MGGFEKTYKECISLCFQETACNKNRCTLEAQCGQQKLLCMAGYKKWKTKEETEPVDNEVVFVTRREWGTLEQTSRRVDTTEIFSRWLKQKDMKESQCVFHLHILKKV